MSDLKLRCICGSTDIEHAFENRWKCGGCGRFHDADALGRMCDAARAQR